MRNISARPRTAVLLLAGLTLACVACVGKPEDPQLTFVNVGFTVKLPTGMQHALD